MTENSVLLIHKVLDGDEKAFTSLVQMYQKRIHALAWRKIGDYHIAEEITQDTFIQVYKNLSTLSNPKQFDGWLYVIANRLCINWIQRHKTPMQSLEATPTHEVEKVYSHNYESEQREKETLERYSDIVKNLLEKLPESERTVITLYYLGEMTAKEIGKFLGVSVNTIKSRLRRARNRLKQDEPMIREAITHFQISPTLSENVLREVSRVKPMSPSGGKPFIPWVLGTTTALLLLLLGTGSQYFTRYQSPYSLESQSEMSVDIVDSAIIQDIESKLDLRNQEQDVSDIVGEGNEGSKDSEQVSTDQGNLIIDQHQQDTVRDVLPQWDLPVGVKARLGKAKLRDMKYSPDGTLIAVAGPVGIWLYDAKTLQELDLIVHAHRIHGYTSYSIDNISFSPDGRTLASCNSGFIALWDIKTRTRINTSIENPTGEYGVLFSPDGQTLAGIDYKKEVHLFNTKTGKLISTIPEQPDSINSIAFSVDGNTIATGDDAGQVRFWDTHTGRLIHTLAAHKKAVKSVKFSPDGKTITTLSIDGKVRLWNADTQRLKHTYSIYNKPIYDVVFSPDGNTLVTENSDETIRLWNTKTGNLIRIIEIGDHVDELFFSPDGETIATASRHHSIQLWDVKSGILNKKLDGHAYPVTGLWFSPDGETLASTTTDNTIRLWNVNTYQLKRVLTNQFSIDKNQEQKAYVENVAFSPDGKILASVAGEKNGEWVYLDIYRNLKGSNNIILWDTETGRQVKTLKGHTSYVESIAFSPDGQTLVSGSQKGNMRFWDVRDGKHEKTLDLHNDSITSISFSHNAQVIAYGNHNGTVSLLDVNTYENIRTFTGHADEVKTLTFSPDDQTLASTGVDSTLRLWDVSTVQQKMVLTGYWRKGYMETFWNVFFRPDGKVVACHSGSSYPYFSSHLWGKIQLWDVINGQHKHQITTDISAPLSTAFSPDGKTIAKGSMDGIVFLWNIPSVSNNSDSEK